MSNPNHARIKREQRRQKRKRESNDPDIIRVRLTPLGFDMLYPPLPPDCELYLAGREREWIRGGMDWSPEHGRLLRAIGRQSGWGPSKQKELGMDRPMPPAREVAPHYWSQVLEIPKWRIDDLLADIDRVGFLDWPLGMFAAPPAAGEVDA